MEDSEPFFSNKGNLGPNIKLVGKNELLQNDQETLDDLFLKTLFQTYKEIKNYIL